MRILVTAGPTQEYFDSVRFISNPSTGKMGYALAEQARRRGHEVVLVSGPVALAAPTGVELVPVVSADQMFHRSVDAFERCDAAIMTAAVCDYRPSRRLDHKPAKHDRPRRITLVPTRDIAAHLGTVKGRRPIITFAMEDHDEHAHAERKLRHKNCDAVVLNGLANVGADQALVEIYRPDGGWSSPLQGSKTEIAVAIVQLLEDLRLPAVGD